MQAVSISWSFLIYKDGMFVAISQNGYMTTSSDGEQCYFLDTRHDCCVIKQFLYLIGATLQNCKVALLFISYNGN